MTTLIEASQVLVDHWRENWTGDAETVLEGEKFEPTLGRAYALVEVLEPDSEQETQGAVGTRRFLRTGALRVTFHTPDGKGTKRGLALCDEVRELYESVNITPLWFHGGARVVSLGVAGVHQRHRITCRFGYQERK